MRVIIPIKYMILILCIVLFPTNITVGAEKRAILCFSAQWCKPCQQLKSTTLVDPKVEKIVKEKQIRFEIIDIDENPKYTSVWKVRSIPAMKFVIYDDKTFKSKVLSSTLGYISAKSLIERIDKLYKGGKENDSGP